MWENSLYNTIKHKIEIPCLLTSARIQLDTIRKELRELEDEINIIKPIIEYD